MSYIHFTVPFSTYHMVYKQRTKKKMMMMILIVVCNYLVWISLRIRLFNLCCCVSFIHGKVFRTEDFGMLAYGIKSWLMSHFKGTFFFPRAQILSFIYK